jgi:hypothetical protein
VGFCAARGRDNITIKNNEPKIDLIFTSSSLDLPGRPGIE